MAVIVVAFGVIMVLSGGYEIYFGSTYITVERGWSAFISGTVLLTGGLMTIAIGFAIRALAHLTAALTSEPRREAIVPGSGIEPAFAEPGLAEPVVAAANDPHDVSNVRPEHNAATAHMEPASAALANTLAPEPTPAMPPADHHQEHDRALDYDHHHVEAQTSEGLEPAPSVAAEAERLVPIGTVDHAAARTASLPDPVAAVQPEDTSPAMDDWLDRSFAKIGHHPVEDPHPVSRAAHAPSLTATAEPVLVADTSPAQGPIEANDDREQRLSEHSAHDAVAVKEAPGPSHSGEASARPDASTPAAHEPAVIGRYEAEGTSYVMYSDGSIDAQSAAGVYRFASMAELKAFIEG